MQIHILTRGVTLLALAASPLTSIPAAAADWPQFLGPKGDGTSTETGVNLDWATKEPQELWKADVGTGCAAVSVAAGKAYTAGQVSTGLDTIFCFDAVTGAKVWTFDYPQSLEPTYYSGGPSSSPTVSDGKVYYVSKDGELYCLDALTGTKIWQKSLIKELGGQKQTWGYAASPVIKDDLLICEPGGQGSAVAALNKNTGEAVWKAGTDKVGYATPLLFNNSLHSGFTSFNGSAIVGYDMTGKQLFRQDWKTQYDVNASTPLHHDGYFLISSGYNTGCALVKPGAGKTEVVWKNKVLLLQFQNMVLVDGSVYAVSGDNQSRATMKCIDFMTGKVHWEERLRENRGNILLVEGKLLVLSESGELLLVQPDTNAFNQLASLQMNKKPCWAPPALANGLLYSRNNDGKVTCFDLRK